MLDFALTFLRCMNKHNLLHVLPGIDRASAITCKACLGLRQHPAIRQSS